MMKHENEPVSYEEFQAEVQQRKRKIWVDTLAAEPAGRTVGRRPRSSLKEKLLLRLDKARLARESIVTQKSTDQF